jgi:hypothetical protein
MRAFPSTNRRRLFAGSPFFHSRTPDL